MSNVVGTKSEVRTSETIAEVVFTATQQRGPLMRLEFGSTDSAVLAQLEERLRTDRFGLSIVTIERSGCEIWCYLGANPGWNQQCHARSYLVRLFDEHEINLIARSRLTII